MLKPIQSKLYLCLFSKSTWSHRFRPTHPKEVYDKIKSFTDRHGIQLELAVDIGCGSGQSTFQLSPLCQQVVGTDISPAQIECAQQSPDNKTISNVEFKVASADQLPFPDGSVSMVTCGQAWHWLEPASVNPEILRVLKRPGCVAIYGHTLPNIQHDECKDLVDNFYRNTLRGYWHDNRKLIDECYRNVSLPLPLTEQQDIDINTTSSVDEYFGYVDTWSGYQSYLTAHPGTTVLADLKQKIQDIISPDNIVNVMTSYFVMLMSRK